MLAREKPRIGVIKSYIMIVSQQLRFKAKITHTLSALRVCACHDLEELHLYETMHCFFFRKILHSVPLSLSLGRINSEMT